MMDKIIKINGVTLPAPTKYDVGIMDISKATRNTLGDMNIEIIATKRKIELDLSMLDSNELSRVLRLISAPPFTVEYQDPQEGTKTGMFYSGDRKASGLGFAKGKMEWKGLTFNIIEM